jgi:hypothetical protein
MRSWDGATTFRLTKFGITARLPASPERCFSQGDCIDRQHLSLQCGLCRRLRLERRLGKSVMPNRLQSFRRASLSLRSLPSQMIGPRIRSSTVGPSCVLFSVLYPKLFRYGDRKSRIPKMARMSHRSDRAVIEGSIMLGPRCRYRDKTRLAQVIPPVGGYFV